MGDSARWKSEALGKPDGREASVICLFVVAMCPRGSRRCESDRTVVSSKIAATRRQAGSPGREAGWTWLRGFRRVKTL